MRLLNVKRVDIAISDLGTFLTQPEIERDISLPHVGDVLTSIYRTLDISTAEQSIHKQQADAILAWHGYHMERAVFGLPVNKRLKWQPAGGGWEYNRPAKVWNSVLFRPDAICPKPNANESLLHECKVPRIKGPADPYCDKGINGWMDWMTARYQWITQQMIYLNALRAMSCSKQRCWDADAPYDQCTFHLLFMWGTAEDYLPTYWQVTLQFSEEELLRVEKQFWAGYDALKQERRKEKLV